MALISVEQLKKDVRIALGENENVGQLLSGEGILDDQMQLERDGLVDSLITDGIDRVNTIAPLAMVAEISEEKELDWNYDEEECVSAILPSDFLRFVSAKLDNWKKPVYNPIDQNSEEYAWQRSSYASIRSSVYRPTVAIVPSPMSGGLQIEMFPQNEEDDPKVRIISRAKINEGNVVVVSASTYRAVVYMIASLYYATIDERDKAKTMAAEAAEVLGLTMQQQ